MIVTTVGNKRQERKKTIVTPKRSAIHSKTRFKKPNKPPNTKKSALKSKIPIIKFKKRNRDADPIIDSNIALREGLPLNWQKASQKRSDHNNLLPIYSIHTNNKNAIFRLNNTLNLSERMS